MLPGGEVGGKEGRGEREERREGGEEGERRKEEEGQRIFILSYHTVLFSPPLRLWRGQ